MVWSPAAEYPTRSLIFFTVLPLMLQQHRLFVFILDTSCHVEWDYVLVFPFDLRGAMARRPRRMARRMGSRMGATHLKVEWEE